MVYNYVDVSVYKDIDITVNCFIFFYYIGSSNSWRVAPGSFIFSLRNNDNIGPFKSPLKDESTYRAIYISPIYGPLFVYGVVILDRYGKCSSNIGNSYHAPDGYNMGEERTKSLLAGSHYFTPSEVEVLYLHE